MLVTAAYIDIASGHGSECEAVHYPRRNSERAVHHGRRGRKMRAVAAFSLGQEVHGIIVCVEAGHVQVVLSGIHDIACHAVHGVVTGGNTGVRRQAQHRFPRRIRQRGVILIDIRAVVLLCGGVFVRNAQRRHVAGVAYIFRGVFRAAAGWDIYVVLTGLGGVVRHGEHGASYGDKLNVRVKRLRSACALQR